MSGKCKLEKKNRIRINVNADYDEQHNEEDHRPRAGARKRYEYVRFYVQTLYIHNIQRKNNLLFLHTNEKMNRYNWNGKG